MKLAGLRHIRNIIVRVPRQVFAADAGGGLLRGDEVTVVERKIDKRGSICGIKNLLVANREQA